jgi:CRP-like cAMP-binding protein
VADDPPPNVVCMDFTRDRRESMATYAARYWLTDLAADDPTSSRVRARIYTALARAGIPLAVPAQTAFVEVKDEARTARREERRLAQRLAALQTVPLFRSFTEAELEILAAGMSQVIYTAGEVITRQGAHANWLYVMTRGSAEERTTYDPDGEGPAPAENKRIATLHAPDFFGEMGLMTGAPREADVVAVTDVECVRLGKATFEQVLLARPAILEELSQRLAARRLELAALREQLDAAALRSRQASESARILDGIKAFFGL